jgi:cell division septum initiation protein DivIVA
MSVELQTGEVAVCRSPADGGVRGGRILDDAARENRRPNVSGDLPTVLQAAPMFRRAVGGYDRFQVDTYVQWAEEELATGDHERERLVARYLDLQGTLEETRQLLSHSPGGGEFLQVSRRIGSLLAAAADEADSMRADAEAHRSAASAEAEQTIAHAERLLAGATAEADRVLTEAATEAAGTLAEARRVAAEADSQAELLRAEARSEAETRLQSVQVMEQRAAEQAEQIRREAVEAASAAMLAARDEVVRMLGTGREERRRADVEAAANRERLEQAALTRSAALRAEVAALERRRSMLRAEVERLAVTASDLADRSLDGPVHRFLETLRWRSRSLRAP